MGGTRGAWLAGAIMVAVLALLSLALAVIRPSGPAACGAGSARIQEGGTLRFAAGGEPSGFNIHSSKVAADWLQNAAVNLYPSVFRSPPT